MNKNQKNDIFGGFTNKDFEFKIIKFYTEYLHHSDHYEIKCTNNIDEHYFSHSYICDLIKDNHVEFLYNQREKNLNELI